MLVRSGLPIIPEIAYSYTVFLASVPSVSVRFRAKRDGEREHGVQIVGTGACFKKRTQGKRGEISSRFFFLVIFSPSLLCSWLCIILDSTEAWHEGPLLSFVCFFFFCCCLFLSLFLRFVVSSSPIRITLECKQIVPLSPHPSPPSALRFFHTGNFSCVTSCDSVWPMKSSLHASYEAQGAEAEGSHLQG